MSVIQRSLNATALHARTADLCATNVWVEDNGFTVPTAYSSPGEEQWALSERAALSDLSAHQTWSVRGADAASFLGFATLPARDWFGNGRQMPWLLVYHEYRALARPRVIERSRDDHREAIARRSLRRCALLGHFG